ncbi:poly polymerase catalytic domain-containing protein [Neocallimastix lanati (nom. inval.)]|jgi:poly [ADP-ribose] polymerase|nr:poly polymerase catalytic domain-containing protein [Neocallimastix sp. JGI-2020a]
MALRRYERLYNKQNDLFSNMVFSFTPGASCDTYLISRIEGKGGKVLKTYTNKVNYVIALKRELAEPKLNSMIIKGLNSTDCEVVSESFINECLQESKIVDFEKHLLKPLSDEDKITHKPIMPKRKIVRRKKVEKKKETEKSDEEEKKEKKKDTTSEEKSELSEKGKKEAEKDDDAERDENNNNKKEEEKREEEKKGEENDNIVKEIRKGRAVVDSSVPNHENYHVFEDGDEVYDATLNQTNISDNNNKYYNLQILKKDDNSNGYFFWTRWGRVGEKGQNNLLFCSSKENAISNFKMKFKDKTGNNWENRKNFVKKNKKYFLLERDYGVTKEVEEDIKRKTKENKINIPDSKLDERLQNLIKLIFDISIMEQEMAEIGYDAKKMPLGKLTKDHIKKSYGVLKKLDEELSNPQPKLTVLADLTSEFYTIIPHDFGRTKPPVINNKELLKKKIEMVESLADIEIASTLLKNQKMEITENPIDTNYKSLHCNLIPLDHKSEDYEMIEMYVENTHGETHSWYELEIDDIYIVDREGEKERFLGNKYPGKKRKLLWHGSRLSNFAGILSQGLRIAPPEAPVSGYMFGKGVYFADMVSKSANYCCAYNQIGLMLLCEVMTGEENNLYYADYNAGELAKNNNKDCTKGCGKTAPDPTKSAYTKDGIEVPYGPAIEVDNTDKPYLYYNEYIVYDVAQIKMRYLIKMKFKKASKK